MKKYREWVRREPSTRQLLITLVLAGGFFLAGLPFLIAVAAGWLDRSLGLSRLPVGIATDVAGILLMVAGGMFAFWAVFAEARIGHGTPVPMIPTQRLVAVPPFTYCRNPMVLGTVVGYLGIGVWLGSVSAITLVSLFAALLLLYVKVLEEKELEARFGADYVKYKRSTPFLLPRIPKRPQGR
jgi:protein-S-isoprenylcysteine O-methyltransferase Ste14